MSTATSSAAGVQVGHWTDLTIQTGCTVVIFDRPCLTAVDVRGGAPATRETDVLAPGRLVQRADAIVLTGGSAFGLASANGVVEELAALGRGVPTSIRPVPVVPAAVIFDLGMGEPIAPDHQAGVAAFRNAGPLHDVQRGRVGAGTGASTAKMPAFGGEQPGGFGYGRIAWSEGSVTALVALNAVGMVQRPGDPDARLMLLEDERSAPPIGEATTIGVVLVDVPCRHDDLVRVNVSAHAGLARSVVPSHTPFDGDLFFAAALREGDLPSEALLAVCAATELAVEAAISDAVAQSSIAL